MEKFCPKCQTLKTQEDFNFQNKSQNLRKKICRECSKKSWNNYYDKNKEKLLKDDKEFYYSNIEYQKQRRKKYRNSELGKETIKKYKSQLHVKIAERLRAQVKKCVKEYSMNKENPTLSYLGCDIEFFINYIIKQFTDGMTLEKLNAGEIHLDHKIPLCSFDLTKEEEINKAFHYSNYRPLWPSINYSKASEDKLLSIH